MNGLEKGLIFDIQRYCIHDGPGIRTVVFFKGCPLRCKWCANPESLNAFEELGYGKNDCIRCGSCVKACKNGAITLGEDGIVINRKKCSLCFDCAAVCPTGAMRMMGKCYSLEEVIEIVKKDEMFYKNSGGGLTLSGGELLRQSEFASALLEKAKELGIHTAIETSGYAQWDSFKQVLKNTDLVLMDIKHVNDEKHTLYTGVSNTLILGNFKKIQKLGKPLIVRIPVIPGFNTDEESIGEYIDFLTGCGICEVNLLAFHQLGESKYDMMGMDYSFRGIKPPTDEEMKAIAGRMQSKGINVKIGG